MSVLTFLEVEFWMYRTLAVCPWANYSISMCLLFPIYKNLMIDGTYLLGLA